MKKIILLLPLLFFIHQPLHGLHKYKTRHHINAGCLIGGGIIFFGCTIGALGHLLNHYVDTKLHKFPWKSVRNKFVPDKPFTKKAASRFLVGATIGVLLCVHGLASILSDINNNSQLPNQSPNS